MLRIPPWVLLVLGMACDARTEPEPAPSDTDADTDSDTDTDADTDTDTGSASPLAATISDIQTGVVPEGTWVEVPGVVVGPQATFGFHLMEPEGSPEWAGVWVAWPDDGRTPVEEGQEVRVTGTTDEYTARGEGGSLTRVDASHGTVLVTGTAPVPAPISASAGALLHAATAEPLEGMLVRLDELAVTTGGTGEWRVAPGLLVDDLYHPATVTEGATLGSLTGLLYWTGTEYAVEPRRAADLQGYVASPEACSGARCAWDLAGGDLVITEVMRNPAAVLDDLGEWFEVWNPGDTSLDLLGIEVSGDATDAGFTFGESLVLPAGGRLVLAASGDLHANGGVPSAVDYDYTHLSLANGAGALGLAFGTVVLDRVTWDDGATFPAPSGATMSLSPAAEDATANDDGASWCAASSSFGAGDLGTPGAPNDPCPP